MTKVRPIGSTYTRGGAYARASQFGGAQDLLRIESGSGAESSTPFLRFVLTVPEGKMIDSFVVSLKLRDATAPNVTISARRVNRPGMAYKSITRNNEPAVYAGSTAVTVTADGKGTHRFDLTADAIACMDDGGYLDLIFTTTSTTPRGIKGVKATTGYPVAELTLVDAAYPPHDVRPDGVVSVGNPTPTWPIPTDVDLVQVQVDEPGGDFSTPLWDSGIVPAGTLSTAGMPSLVEGEDERPVRMQQHFPTGWSGWSYVTWKRVAQPVLSWVTTSPTTGDETPPQAVTSSKPISRGEFVALTPDGVEVASSGPIQPDADGMGFEWTPEKVLYGGDGQALQWEARAWDGEDRSPSPGDPTYASLRRTQTYVRTDTVAPLEDYRVRQCDELPCLVHSWRRADTPDQVVIERDGRIMAPIDGLETTLTDWACRPNVEIEHSAFAKVNGETSAKPRIQTVRMVVTGIWLVDPMEDRWFCLSGTDGLQIAYGSSEVVHTPLQAAALVRRQGALRGPEGTVSGWLTDAGGRTADEQLEDVWAMRASRVRRFRWIAGDLNIPVSVGGELAPGFDPDRSFSDEHSSRMMHRVSYTISHDGSEPHPWEA